MTELEDGTVEIYEEEIGPETKMDDYVKVKEHLDIAREAMHKSVERRKRDNSRAFRNCEPEKFAARDNDLAKIKSDEEAFNDVEFARREQYSRDFQSIVYRPFMEKKKIFEDALCGAIKVFKELDEILHSLEKKKLRIINFVQHDTKLIFIGEISMKVKRFRIEFRENYRFFSTMDMI